MKRLSLALLLLYLLSFAVCFALLVLDTNTVSIARLGGGLALLLFGIGGYLFPGRATTLTTLLWTVVPALLIFMGEYTGSSVVWFLDMPHRFTALLCFHGLFHQPGSAFLLSTIQPLAVAVCHILMMLCFFIGNWLSPRRAAH